MLRFFLFLSLVFLPAYAEDHPPCVIPKGPPCISLSDPRLKDPSCIFEVGSCFTLQWDEYGGGVIIEEAEIIVTPTCKNKDAMRLLEKKGRDYLESLQTIPIQITITQKPCETKGFVDVKVTKYKQDDPLPAVEPSDRTGEVSP